MGPQGIINQLMLKYPKNHAYVNYTPSAKSCVVDVVKRMFDKYEGRLETALLKGKLSREQRRVYRIMENSIGDLLQAGLEVDAYKLAMRYASVRQNFSIH